MADPGRLKIYEGGQWRYTGWGLSGYSGYSGSGVSGYSGYSGDSGYSGYSGDSGYSGYSGLPGTGLTARGAWDSGTTYDLNDLVTYEGNAWLSLQNTNLNHIPAEDTWWTLFAAEGTSGYSGYSGSGVSGYSGYSGESGYSGYSSASGYSGYSGISGYSGYSGISGYSGYSGISGYSGFSGYSGYSGISGYSGYSADSGYSGYSGRSGYSGYSGESGYSGYSGLSGYSGYSGISGYSGAQGSAAYQRLWFDHATEATTVPFTTETLTFNNAAPATITRPSGSFILDGWVARQKISINTTLNPNKVVEIRSVAALTLTLCVTSTLVQETTGATITVDNEKLTRVPPTGGPFTETLTGITNADPNGIPFDSYLTVVGFPGATVIPAGTWIFHGWFSATNVSCSVQYQVCSRSADGLTTTVLFTTTNGPSSLTGTLTEYVTQWTVAADIPILSTDRIIVRVLGYNSAANLRNMSFQYAGAANSSYVDTTFTVLGVSGWSGYSGYSSISGYSGYSGFSGYSGYSGYSGPSGYSGYSSASGYSGYSGLSGYSGYSSDSGYSGYSGSGVSGYSGYSGETISGYSGYSADSGYSGYSGLSGYSGYSSESGYSGYSGMSGYSGYSGYSGIGITSTGAWDSGTTYKLNDLVYYDTQAYISLQDSNLNKVPPVEVTYWTLFATGSSGYSGYSGFSGYSGYSGSGISGYSGYSGESTSGYSGYSADSGYSGYSGFSGYSGYSADSGYSGYSGSGISGYSGYSGFSGYSGYSSDSGFSGYSGYSSESGYSGYSGPSGYSGYSSLSGYSGFSGSAGSLTGITYYTDDNSSDIGGGYLNALRTPDADPEVQFTAIGDGTGVLIKNFATPFGDPSVTLIESGVWGANVWAYIDSSGGTNTVKIEVYQRASGGSETFLFSMETDDITGVGHANVARYEVIVAQGEINLLTTDRIVFRFLAKSTAGKTIGVCVGGTTHYSHVHTPLIAQGYSGASGYSGYSGLGLSGYSGYSGASTSGYSGYSGPSGYSGYSSLSGYSGYSGAGVSGYSGYSGNLPVMDSAPANGVYNGIKTTFTMGETIAQGDVCYINSSGKAVLAKADVIANASAIVMATEAGVNNDVKTFLVLGIATDNDWSALTAGSFIYLSAATAGKMTATAPSSTNNVVQILGWAKSAQTIFFNPSLVQVERV